MENSRAGRGILAALSFSCEKLEFSLVPVVDSLRNGNLGISRFLTCREQVDRWIGE
jgi:hypothetical protein